MPGQESLPGTLRRSPKKAQETWIKTHDSAVESYGDGERAHRTAFKSLKHSFEKVEDRWVAKKQKGPSDPRSEHRGKAARDGRGEALGGVDLFGHTKAELYERAKRLDVKGRSTMDKLELARAIDRKQS
ncbi:MAG: ChaB family protein [Chloroflexi bacterium]|nr:ChaB family protein [Chloroflexota bacterium]